MEDCKGVKPPRGKKRHVGDLLPCQILDESVVDAMCDVIEVLDADDLRDGLGLSKLRGADIAQAEMTNESLALQLGEHDERFGDGAFGRPRDPSDPQVDDIQGFKAEVAEVVVNRVDEFLPGESGDPRLVGAAASAYFGYDYEVIRIRVKGLLDDLVGYVGAVKVAGIDMVYASRDGFPQNSNGGIRVARRSKYLRASELHRTVAHAIYSHVCAGKCKGAAKVGLFGHAFLLIDSAGDLLVSRRTLIGCRRSRMGATHLFTRSKPVECLRIAANHHASQLLRARRGDLVVAHHAGEGDAQ